MTMDSILGAHLYGSYHLYAIRYLSVGNSRYRNRTLLWFGLTRPSVSLLQLRLDSPWGPRPARPAHPAGLGLEANVSILSHRLRLLFPTERNITLLPSSSTTEQDF